MRTSGALQRLILGVALMAAVSALPARSDPPPAAAYAALPPIADIALSPDGKRAVMLRAIGETYHAVLADFASGEARPLMAADPDAFLFNWCRWANPERVICSIRSYATLRAGQMPDRVRRYRDGRTVFTRLLAVNADGSGVLQLVPEAVTRVGEDLEWNSPVQDTVVSWLDDDADHVLIQLQREGDRPSVYRLNVYTNRLHRVRRMHDAVLRWYADRSGALRLAGGYRGLTPVAFAVRGNRVTELDVTGLTGVRPPAVAALDPGGTSAYVFANNGRDTRALYRIDIDSGRVLETVHSAAGYDVDGRLVLHPGEGRPLALHYNEERPVTVWFDTELAGELERLRQALPGGPEHLRLASLDRSAERFVFSTEGGATLPRLYLYDRRTPDELVLLAQAYPDVPQALSTQAVSYRARDGLRIPAYLTLPAGTSNQRVPAIVLPHGGPWWRDDGGFDYWAQFLASRGYAVLQPNFRGSAGYGDRFLAAGFEQWGLAMQDDLLDGLDWLIERGIADPERVCFVGGSYGGYAALVAAFRTPERLRCAVAFAGVTDLEDLVRRMWQFQLGELSVARVQDGTARRDASPIEQVERIGVPLLIVHGDLDRSVMIEQSRDLVEALEKAGKPHRYIEQSNGDHFLSLYSQRLEFLEALEAFLARHLGG